MWERCSEQPGDGASETGSEQGYYDAAPQREQSNRHNAKHYVLPSLAEGSGERDR
ncbi:MAG TPA: hypothetical protein VGL79_08000 [Solirubrobacteraceae bacterium]